MFLYAIIYMINLSILPQLILQKVCLQNANGNETLCQSPDDYTPELKMVKAVLVNYFSRYSHIRMHSLIKQNISCLRP